MIKNESDQGSGCKLKQTYLEHDNVEIYKSSGHDQTDSFNLMN